ncbi:MAG: hypothetical protein KME05_06840 [Gloeocapsa sp. UFS-A4-WI-NPMV-4B04]|nr:hypothetical protein [Gloeocapsa sp. UFS-A4-WI-NPMV-4B04]
MAYRLNDIPIFWHELVPALLIKMYKGTRRKSSPWSFHYGDRYTEFVKNIA